MNEYSEKDALSPENAGETRDFRIKMTSVIVSLETKSGEHGAAAPPEAPGVGRMTAETSRVESVGLASVRQKDGRIEITYDDPIENVPGGALARLSFETAQPGIVTIERRGLFRTLFVFEKGCRHPATYKTPYGGFDITVYSRSVENSLGADGGKLRIEYFVEFRGASDEKVTLDFEVERIG